VDTERLSQLRLVSYNIWGMPTWISGASPARYVRIADALERQNSDVVLLQEVWSQRSRQAVPAGWEWSIASAEPVSCFFRRNGLVCLSRFPILQGEFRPFRSASWPDSLVEKGALKITIDLGGGRRLNLWNVHLQAGKAARARSHQIGELVEWVRQAEDGQIGDIIAGDFNCTPESPEYAQLVRALGQDVCELANQRHFATYYGGSAKPGQARTLDYVFVRARHSSLAFRAGFEPVFDADRPEARLSDHLGLGVELNLDVIPVFSKLPPGQGSSGRAGSLF
jgi:endonuclease/exonuclease/phosphatase family metal-dependent hydrolase